MLRKAVIVLSALALAIAAAGCGEDKNAAYAKQVNNLITENFGGQVESLASEMGSGEDDQAVLERTAQELRQLARKLGQIKPPSDKLRPEIRNLQDALKSYASAVDQEAKEPDHERFSAATQLAGTSIKAIVNNLNAKL